MEDSSYNFQGAEIATLEDTNQGLRVSISAGVGGSSTTIP